MSDNSETEEDTKKDSLAEMTAIDDSCTLEFIEIVPVDRVSDDCHRLEYTDRVVEVKPEDLQDVKQEPADEYKNGQCFAIEVSSACTLSTDFDKIVAAGLQFCICLYYIFLVLLRMIEHFPPRSAECCETWIRLFLVTAPLSLLLL